VRRFILLLVLLLVFPASADAAPKKPKVHRVAKGQTLGKIAKRYNVGVDAICHANDITRRARIKPGLKLYIPPRDDKDGSRTRKLRQRAADKAPAKSTKPKKSKKSKKKGKREARRKAGAKKKKKTRRAKPGRHRHHTVIKGQRLGTIAKRYRVTVDALTHANDLGPRGLIKPGQRLIVPARGDVDGSLARAARLNEAQAPTRGVRAKRAKKRGSSKSWSKYVKRPKKRGYVTLVGRKGRSWKGYAVNRKGRALSKAKKAFKRVLATRSGEAIKINSRLISLIAKVSDTFGGRGIKIVSGYRLGDTSERSRHRHGKAIDFIIDGVPNSVVRDYVKTFDRVGVGFYPNSHFVHLDVRKQWTYWIDYSRPGERPRYAGFWTR